MAKRRRSPPSDDENWSEGDISPASTDSELEDASFGVNPKSSSSKKKTPTTTRRKAKVLKIDAYSRSSSTNEPCSDLPAHAKSTHIISAPGPVRRALLAWYKTVRDTRGMPWRKPYDPAQGAEERAQRAYEVWISEIMLQQTQVATVIPYYNRWMEKFPTIQALAGATIDEVNSLWKGLGYYSRASRLLAGAQKVVKEYDGRLPDSAKAMEANIPGIGRYSAGAICSIAYGERVPVLDGNVHRLLSRFLALHAPPKAKSTLDILWDGARAMVEIEIDEPSGNTRAESPATESESQYPGDINQSLIELGSTVCKVREPNCESCPLQTWCVAYQTHTASKSEGKQSTPILDIEDACRLCEPVADPPGVLSYPMKVDRKKAREELDIVHVVEWRSRTNLGDRQFLMVRRPENGGLDLLNVVKCTHGKLRYSSMTCEMQEALPAEILSKLFVDISSLSFTRVTKAVTGKKRNESEPVSISTIRPAGEVVHVFSHIRKTYKAQWVVLEGGHGPPSLVNAPVVADEKPRRKQFAKKTKVTKKDEDAVGELDGPKGVVWVPFNEIMQTNMGSGVVKVWNITKKLWEEPIDNDG